MAERHYAIDDLLTLMARLRDPQTGCPWDCEQDFRSIVPHTLEEAHEVADAIERDDMPHLRDELGDLLFQVIFYAQLGREAGHFDWQDIVDQLVRKLLRRHPHVFPDGTLESRAGPDTPRDPASIKANWERIKAEERAGKREAEAAPASALDDIPAALPALTRAGKLQRRAAHQGFDWPDLAGVFRKLAEEVEELQEAAAETDPEVRQERSEDELGDLLFVCVNLARFLNVNPEQALRRANRKFERRFRRMETQLAEKNTGFEGLGIEALEEHWQAAKKALRNTYNP